MRQEKKFSLFTGDWAIVRTGPLPQISMTARGFYQGYTPAISRQPSRDIIVLTLFKEPAFRKSYPDLFTIEELARIVCLLWRHTSVIRYCELWVAFTTEKFVKGMLGTPKLRYWIERVVKGQTDRRDYVKMVYTSHKKWSLVDIKTAYPHIRRWSEVGIRSARKCAWKQTKARNML